MFFYRRQLETSYYCDKVCSVRYVAHVLTNFSDSDWAVCAWTTIFWVRLSQTAMFLQPPKIGHVPGESSTKTKRKPKRQRKFVESWTEEVFVGPPSLSVRICLLCMVESQVHTMNNLSQIHVCYGCNTKDALVPQWTCDDGFWSKSVVLFQPQWSRAEGTGNYTDHQPLQLFPHRALRRRKQSESRILLSTLLDKTEADCSEGDCTYEAFSQTSVSSSTQCVEEIKE